MNLSTSPVWVSKRSLLTSILDGAIVPRIDECTDLQVGLKVDQFVQLHIVIDVFFPLQQNLSSVMLLLPKESLVRPSSVSDWKRRFFQRYIAFVGQFDL